MIKFPRDSKNQHSAADLAWFWEQLEKRGWDPYGGFAVIRLESSWDPAIRNSIGATGLIQVTNSTARYLFGFPDASPIAKMGFREQLEKIAFPYWERGAKARPYKGPESFFLWGLGGGTGALDPDDGSNILYRAGTAGAKGNPHIVNKVTGNMTEKSVASSFAPFVSMQRKAPHETYSLPVESEKKNSSSLSCPYCGGCLHFYMEKG